MRTGADPGRRSRRRRASLGRPAAALLLVATCVLLGVQALRAPIGAPPARQPASDAARESATTTAASPDRERAAGWRVVVPRLHLDVRVVPVSSRAGTLVPPADPEVLGWWSSGARPGGDRGSVLIAGHTVHATGGGALAGLSRLRAGDRVTVVSGRGPATYVVTSNRYLSKDALADHAPVLFEQAGPARLVLVTCTHWHRGAYHGNTVVTAVPR